MPRSRASAIEPRISHFQRRAIRKYCINRGTAAWSPPPLRASAAARSTGGTYFLSSEARLTSFILLLTTYLDLGGLNQRENWRRQQGRGLKNVPEQAPGGRISYHHDIVGATSRGGGCGNCAA